MRALVQRITYSTLKVDGEIIAKTGKGLIVYLGVKKGDSEEEVEYVAKKVAGLRVFEDEDGKMNLSVKDVGGEILAVSQFTLYGDTKKGFRPSFFEAEEPNRANALFELFKEKLNANNVSVKSGIFGADMKIEYLNDGPVSVIVEKERQ
ncbi:MAG: D-tyrosyl-tRNA(Tyr) deacylase [Clostridia bacterium]|nr:D-tyrosyl-tRNA(Tyr) deacylase [Clostridia bacterium]MBR2323763.1 D-tyrosyl-tRNA(Tyr) deacylase [Clostridia bacterium]MBR2397980.1 D-tyrosyl-tRNA(Tyr) deacylase [Clostridia bacterium]MBR2875230.1 D-tyrosyl-tRNA(Tyr) deacylase [Clostridia bacterium]MBR6693228.1 D-tyrosyl-tRNA(Tyr) deacylase [Clostridia bacterium]